MRGLAVLTAALAAWTFVGGPLPRVVVPDLRLPGLPHLLIGAGLFAATTLLVLGLTGLATIALAIGALVAMAMVTLGAKRRPRSKDRLREQWPDLLALVQSRLAGGSALPDAFAVAVERLDPPPEDLVTLVEEWSTSGRRFHESLEELRARLADPVADRVLSTLATAHLTGGRRVVEILAILNVSVGDELRLRAAHEAALTQQRLTAAVALIAPWALLLLTVATNPSAAEAYLTSTGSLIVLIGLASTVLGYLLALRVSRLSRAPRLLR